MIPLPLIDARNESELGGKAVALGEALRRHLPVPDGTALSVRQVHAIAQGQPDALQSLRDHHAAHYQGKRIAVRSSAVGEDSAGASFAGQHLTRLGVADADGLVRAVAEVWQSGSSDSALAYRRRMGVQQEPAVAVVLQLMVEPRCAGVLFCRDPLDGSDRRVVEAAWGLGEAVVTGIVTPDRFVMERDGRVTQAVAGLKDVAYVQGPDGDTHEIDVPPRDHAKLCLSPKQLSALNDLAGRCEAAFGSPQDIEWAFANGELYLLQSRPITR